MTGTEVPRSQWVARIRDDLTTITRRGTARARQSHPAFSLVDQSLLTYIESSPGCRAIDIASHFQLNRSTVSRQLQGLAKVGLIRLDTEQASHGRGQPITLTQSGQAVQAKAADDVLHALTSRLAQFSDEEVRIFAGTLRRFNDAPAPVSGRPDHVT